NGTLHGRTRPRDSLRRGNCAAFVLVSPLPHRGEGRKASKSSSLVRYSLTLCTEQLEPWRGKAVLKLSWQTVRQCLGYLLLDLLLASLVLLLLAHWPRQILFLSRGSERPEWLNVTPGYPDRVPLISLLRYSPWPLPPEHNFSAILSLSIPGDEPVLLKGRPNQVRYWSFVFYPAGAAKHDRDLPALDSSTLQLKQNG